MRLQEFCTSNYEPHDYWAEDVIHDAKEIAALMGIYIDKVYFSGFWSQGDGACFTGHLGYDVDCLEKVMEYAPQDKELHEIATRWVNLRCPELEGRVTHSSRYCHSNSVSFSIEEDLDVDENAVIIAAKQLMDWIYGKLEESYNYAKAYSFAESWMTAMETIEEGRVKVRELAAALRTGLLAGVAKEAIEYQLQDVWSVMDKAKREREFLADNFHYWQDAKLINIRQFADENY